MLKDTNTSNINARSLVVQHKLTSNKIKCRKIEANLISGVQAMEAQEIIGSTITANEIVVNKMTANEIITPPTWQYSNGIHEVRASDPATVTLLKNSDFAAGTVRLTKAGTYRIVEDIVFDPNPTDNWLPRPDQSLLYPPAKYRLGFFAALTIEGDGIVVDGGGFMISQSLDHYMQQRFFSVIELADQPFIPRQGPAPMSPVLVPATNSRVHNLILGLSSHHGIHGNNCRNIVLENITVTQFEIAGIAINGGVGVCLKDIVISGSSNQVPVLSTYSQARFIQPFWSLVDLSKSITLRGQLYTGTDLKNNLLASMDEAFSRYKAGDPITDNLFANHQGITECNQYGLVLNMSGVAVNELPMYRDPRKGNSDITVENVSISCITGAYQEIASLSVQDEEKNKPSSAYAKVQAGPVGDVFRYMEVSNKQGHYTGNVLSDAQIFLSREGFGSIQEATVQWAQTHRSILTNPYLLTNLDTMAHFSKSSVGILVIGADKLRMKQITVDGIYNEGTSSFLPSNSSFRGADSTGMLICASQNIRLDNDILITNIESTNARAFGLILDKTPAPLNIPKIVQLRGGKKTVNYSYARTQRMKVINDECIPIAYNARPI